MRSTSRSRRWRSRRALDFPDFEQDYEFVSLRHPAEYPLNEGRIVSSRGLDIAGRRVRGPLHRGARAPRERAALGAQGARARTTSARSRATASTSTGCRRWRSDAARAAGLGPVCQNPFQSIVVRAVELVFACHEALALIEAYEPPERPFVDVEPREATGHGASEAPRGLLYHRYSIGADGLVRSAKIVPPTAQNQKTIEKDLWHFVPTVLDLPKDELTWRCEQAIRNYDPCISCATHFLKLDLQRELRPQASRRAGVAPRS